MIFELAHHVQSFLSEHNKPPPKSFHEEMLERQAQEKQQRLLEARRKEEQEVRSGCWCWPKPGGLQASMYLLSLPMNVSVSFPQHLIEEMCILGGEIPTSSLRNIPLPSHPALRAPLWAFKEERGQRGRGRCVSRVSKSAKLYRSPLDLEAVFLLTERCA